MTSTNSTAQNASVANPQICVCYDVYQDEIIHAIQQGANTVEKISELTYACQGCGSCRERIEKLLVKFSSS